MFVTQEELITKIAPPDIRVEPPKIQLEARRPTFTITARMHSRKEYEFVDSMIQEIMDGEECDEASAILFVFRAYSKPEGA